MLGDWLVQPLLGRLTRGTEIVHLEPRTMDLLVLLVSRGGKVLSKREILDALWAKRYVSEATLTHAIAELRRALGDDARAPRFIATVPKRGYRAVAVAVTCEGPSNAGEESSLGVLVVAGRRHPLADGVHLVGRSPAAGVRIDSIAVSRCHARIEVRNGQAMIEDLGSKNGTFVGPDPVTAPRTLRDGDEVRFGTVVARFCLRRELQSTAAAPPPPLGSG